MKNKTTSQEKRWFQCWQRVDKVCNSTSDVPMTLGRFECHYRDALRQAAVKKDNQEMEGNLWGFGTDH